MFAFCIWLGIKLLKSFVHPSQHTVSIASSAQTVKR